MKKLNGEDISTVSPTLGFNIKSFGYKGSVPIPPCSLTIVATYCIGLTQANDKQVLRSRRYTLNVWDVGGQRTLRPYWRNYFEATDAVVWVVDSSDRLRTKDCQEELKGLLQEEVSEAEADMNKRGELERLLTRLSRV